jgi:hypothetical protein
MVLDHLETAEVIGLFGGTLAGLSWIPSFVLLFRIYYWMPIYPVGLWFAPALTGFLVCGLSFHAAVIAQKTPERAKQNFNAAGIIGLIVGFLCFLNLALILSSIFVLIAGGEANAAVETIAQARRRTGFPLRTVATAAGGPWNRRLSCAYCGAPLVVTAVAPQRPDVRIEARCPLDGIHDRQRLPLSQLEEWAPVLADRLHRCVRCGERTAALLVIHQGVLFTTLHPVCPNQHNTPFRRVWTPVYSHVAQVPPVDAGYRAAGVPSLRVYGAQGVQPAQPLASRPMTGPTTPPPQFAIPPSQPATPTPAPYPPRFCRICGARVEADDQFCCQCGGMIQ